MEGLILACARGRNNPAASAGRSFVWADRNMAGRRVSDGRQQRKRQRETRNWMQPSRVEQRQSQKTRETRSKKLTARWIAELSAREKPGGLGAGLCILIPTSIEYNYYSRAIFPSSTPKLFHHTPSRTTEQPSTPSRTGPPLLPLLVPYAIPHALSSALSLFRSVSLCAASVLLVWPVALACSRPYSSTTLGGPFASLHRARDPVAP